MNCTELIPGLPSTCTTKTIAFALIIGFVSILLNIVAVILCAVQCLSRRNIKSELNKLHHEKIMFMQTLLEDYNSQIESQTLKNSELSTENTKLIEQRKELEYKLQDEELSKREYQLHSLMQKNTLESQIKELQDCIKQISNKNRGEYNLSPQASSLVEASQLKEENEHLNNIISENDRTIEYLNSTIVDQKNTIWNVKESYNEKNTIALQLRDEVAKLEIKLKTLEATLKPKTESKETQTDFEESVHIESTPIEKSMYVRDVDVDEPYLIIDPKTSKALTLVSDDKILLQDVVDQSQNQVWLFGETGAIRSFSNQVTVLEVCNGQVRAGTYKNDKSEPNEDEDIVVQCFCILFVDQSIRSEEKLLTLENNRKVALGESKKGNGKVALHVLNHKNNKQFLWVIKKFKQ
ncbi:hypothetical protein AKO1_007708 [Acrasis kona]|uniref:Uncharacterized protein n=1 Tax=Acrasis kona TaxID=1008807 RepID=A0AAW2YS09_9EUKA